MSSGMFINAGVLFHIAKQAYERAKSGATSDRSHDSNDPLIAIVFAATAGDAFINEIGELAAHPSLADFFPQFQPEPGQIQQLASLLGEVEALRGPTNIKYLLAKLALTGKTFDKGTNPYQDFALLTELRNSVIHLKFDRIKSMKIGDVRIDQPPIINKLRAKNILVEFEDPDTTASWVLQVSTPAAAKWACNATAAIVHDIVDSIPTSELRRKADLFYGKSFDAIP